MKLKVVDSDPWYAQGLDFSCTGCGNCCTGGPGYVWISDQEVQRLAQHLGQSVEQVVQRYCRRIGGRLSLKENLVPSGEYDCIFLHQDPHQPPDQQPPRRICAIYPVRPLQCRTWPFWDSLLTSRKAWHSAKRRCPGIDNGQRHSRQEIEKLRDAKDWPPEQNP